MMRFTPFFRWVSIAVLLAWVLCFAMQHANAAEGDKITPSNVLPVGDAVSTVAIVDQQGNLYSVIVSMKDGNVLVYNQASAVDAKALVAWVLEHGGRKITVTAPTVYVGGPVTHT